MCPNSNKPPSQSFAPLTRLINSNHTFRRKNKNKPTRKKSTAKDNAIERIGKACMALHGLVAVELVIAEISSKVAHQISQADNHLTINNKNE